MRKEKQKKTTRFLTWANGWMVNSGSFIKFGKIEHKKFVAVKMSLDLVIISSNYLEKLI